MSFVHIDYVFLTIKSKGLRVAIGNKSGSDSIVYTYSGDSDVEDENFYSYRAYIDALTEQEGQEIQHLTETKQIQKAHNFLFKRMKQDNCLGPCGPTQLSDLIPDEWFDGCKWAIDLLEEPRTIGVFPVDIEVED